MNSYENLLIIIPAFNEQDSIANVLQDIQKLSIDHVSVLVVNDGSEDNTENQAKIAGADFVVSHSTNLGIGGAIHTGLLFAKKFGFDAVIRLDADGQHDPSDITKFINFSDKDKYNLIIGSRFLDDNGFKSTNFRKFGINILSILCKLLTGLAIKDVTSGFRFYDKSAISVLAIDYPTDYPEPDEIIILHKKNMTIKEIPVTMRHREEGTSSIRGWNTIFYMLKVSLSMCISSMR